MSSEDKSPYFSKRIRIGDVTSLKDLVGYKDFTVEIIYGNQEKIKVVKNPKDVADIEEKAIFDDVEQLFQQRDEWAKKRGFKFVDQIEPKKDELKP